MPLQVINGIGIAGIRGSSSNQSNQVSLDTDAQAFITAASIIDTTQKNAVNDLVLALKASGLWAKMNALYPMVGGTSTSHSINLKTPGTYNLVFNGGWSHSITGAYSNGSNAYATTGVYLPSLNSTHISFYARMQLIGNFVMGSKRGPAWSTSAGTYLRPRGPSQAEYTVNTNAGPHAVNNSNSQGLFIATRTTSTSSALFIRGVKNSNSSTSTSAPITDILLGAAYTQTSVNYGQQECAFASIGVGLTDVDVSNFHNTVQAFQTTLGRQV